MADTSPRRRIEEEEEEDDSIDASPLKKRKMIDQREERVGTISTQMTTYDAPSQSNTTIVRCFTFGRRSDAVTVRIPDLHSTGMSSFLWPASIYLTSYLASKAFITDFACHRGVGVGAPSSLVTPPRPPEVILEVGSGRGLCGLYCARAGWCKKVILTDGAKTFREEIAETMRLNQTDSTVVVAQQLVWGDLSSNLLTLRSTGIDLILGADLMYERADFDSLFATIGVLSRPFLTAYHHRGEGKRRILQAARKWRMAVRTIPFELEEVEESIQTIGDESSDSTAPASASSSSSSSSLTPASSSLVDHSSATIELLLFTPMT